MGSPLEQLPRVNLLQSVLLAQAELSEQAVAVLNLALVFLCPSCCLALKKRKEK